jgi:hypothetical protein
MLMVLRIQAKVWGLIVFNLTNELHVLGLVRETLLFYGVLGLILGHGIVFVFLSGTNVVIGVNESIHQACQGILHAQLSLWTLSLGILILIGILEVHLRVSFSASIFV